MIYCLAASFRLCLIDCNENFHSRFIFLVLSKNEAQTFTGSADDFLKVDSLTTLHKKHSAVIKPVTIATAYAGATLFCYRFLDDEVNEIRRDGKTKLLHLFQKPMEALAWVAAILLLLQEPGLLHWLQKIKGLKKYLYCLLPVIF